MSGSSTTYPTTASFISKNVLFRALIVALVLGSILTFINQPNAVFGSDTILVLPFLLVFLTPFAVVTVSQALGIRRATWEARFGNNPGHHNSGFIATAMSHGIPVRALLVAAAAGITNTSITAVVALVSGGTLVDLPTALIGQAFALPMVFGFISQALSYRRAVAAINQPPLASSQPLPI